MNLTSQKRIAADTLKIGKTRVWIDETKVSEVKEAVTKHDIRSLIKDGVIKAKPQTGISRFRARARLVQRRKGRQTQTGSRKGKRTARLPSKVEWMFKIRKQRNFLKELKEKKLIEPVTYRNLYLKSKGNFFRSKAHIKLYMTEHKLINKNVK